MTTYVCKMCGRAIKIEKGGPPNYCYYDRMNHIEEVSQEDADRMGLFSVTPGEMIAEGTKILWTGESDFKLLTIEFIKDMRYWPMSGGSSEETMSKRPPQEWDYSLSEFQDLIMRRVRRSTV